MKKLQSLEYLLVMHCAPTLAGIKEGSMFSFTYEGEFMLQTSCDCWKKHLSVKGLKLEILRRSANKALLYVYWPMKLKELLSQCKVNEVLRFCGYQQGEMEQTLLRLKERIAGAECFPHEIGIFLGYPLEDVIGFIENKGKNCAMCGYWKVYCNERQAEKTFALYTKCRELYQKLFAQGVPVLQLIAA